MEDSEKLTALKKAYADIILNTAKEAAARVMVSERKAMLFQQELASSKDEALRMLLRLKQMLDSKVNEAEQTSLSQQKKIEELEAQLQEAEEIVRDLRAELRETQAELEKVTNNQLHPPVEQNIDQIAAQGNLLPENRLDAHDGSLYSVPDLQFEPVTISDSGNSTVNGTNDSSKLHMSHDHINNCYIHNPDFASIVIRRKEPELYRNGCTQRIRALERSLFDGNMSPSGNSDVQNETLVRVDEEAKAVPVTTNAEVDVICEKEKSDEVKVVNADADHMKVVPVRRKKRRFRIRKALQSRLQSGHVKETNKASYLSCAKGSPCVLDSNDTSRENSSTVYENEAQKDLESPLFAKVPTDATAMVEQSGSHNNAEKGEVFLKACSVWNKTKDDQELLDKSDLTRQESLSNESLEVPTCRADIEAANESLDKLDPKISDLDEKVSCQSVSDKFLKYTFRRKRKRESLSSADVDCSLENNSLKKKCGEKQNGNVEPQKSCTVTESSRDSRRLAQVARQLISLSEKKWWQ